MSDFGFLAGSLCVLVVLGLMALGAWSLVKSFAEPAREEPRRRRSSCPSCRVPLHGDEWDCPSCRLKFDGKLVREIERIRHAQVEVRALSVRGELEGETAERVAGQLEDRIRTLMPYAPAPLPRAIPVVHSAEPVLDLPPVEATEVVPQPPTPPATDEPSETVRPGVLAAFLEEKNILWGELVGGLLIVGCSIALVLTLWRDLQDLPYSSFLLAAGITAALFGAGQYTLHHWKLASTSRGLLVIALLLVPLNLLLLATPQGNVGGWIDVAVKLAAVLLFVGLVRAAGRDLIGVDVLPGPVDRRWLLALAVVGAPASQALPLDGYPFLTVWLPLGCQAFASFAVVGGLSWYRRREERPTLTERQAISLMMFAGLGLYALFAAWGWLLTRSSDRIDTLMELAFPLALSGIPLLEAGLLVQRRATTHAGVKATGTGATLVGALLLAAGMVLSWPNPLWVMLAAALAGVVLTRVAWRESLPWFQAAATAALGYALVLAVQGLADRWTVPEGESPNRHLLELLATTLSGLTLTAFGIALALVSEVAVRFGQRAQALAYGWAALAAAMLGLLLVSDLGTSQPWAAVAVYAACGFGLLAANLRWRERALAEAGGFILLVGCLWTLEAASPDDRTIWGTIFAIGAFASAALALGLTPLAARPGAISVLLRQYRSAAANVAAAAGLVALVLTLIAPDFPSGRWHSTTLFLLVPTGLALARTLAHPWPTWAASAAALFGLAHLFGYGLAVRPPIAALSLALLSHATLAILGSLLVSKKRSLVRLFKDPLRFSARITTVFAAAFLFFPPTGLALEWSGLAVWLAVLWFAMAWRWRESTTFSGMSVALAVASVLGGLAWIERQEWWLTTNLGLQDPRALQAFGSALALLAFASVIARRLASHSERLHEIWLRHPLPIDRVLLGSLAIGQLLLLTLAIAPAVTAEMIPVGRAVWNPPPAELVHAFGPGTWIGLGVLFVCLVAALRLARAHDPARDALIVGCFLLVAGGVAAWAGSFAPQVAAASALRWGLAGFFLVGTLLVVVREPLARGAAAMRFRAKGSQTAAILAYFMLAVAATVVVVMAVDLASVGMRGQTPSGPGEGTVFFAMGWTISNVTPLLLVVLGLSASAVRERASGYAFAAGVVFVSTATGGYALSVTTAGGSLDAVIQMRLAMLATGTAAAWSLLWLAGERRVPGGPLLTLQTIVGILGVGTIAVVPLARLALFSGEPLPSHYLEFGRVGWFVLALAAWAAFEHACRHAPDFRAHIVGLSVGIASILAACTVQPWDEPGLFASFDTLLGFWALAGLGLTAALFARTGAALGPWIVTLSVGIATASLLRPASDAGLGAVPLLLAGFALAASAIVARVGRTDDDSRWNWLIVSQGLIAFVSTGFAIRMALVEPNIWARFSGPLAVLILAVAAVALSTARWKFAALRYVSFAAIAFVFVLVGWAIPDPDSPTTWLERNGWAFVALAAGTLALGEGIPRRFSTSVWALDARRAGVALAAAALGLLPIVLVQQLPVFDPYTSRTPLELLEVLAILAAIVVLMVQAVRLALRPSADPLGLTGTHRTRYVYLAEVLLVLLFVHVRLNLPELFPPQAGRYWTFLVMLFAFIGIGFAEWFENRGVWVLAVPLRRTGVLLPLIPLVAFWAKPPVGLLSWADGTAPGARPFLGYLEKLPQYFDNYAGLWLMAGLLYGLLALSRRSFGWALLAALATNAGFWAILAHNDVSAAMHPQIWVIPLSLIVLAAEHVNRRELRPSASAGLRYLGIGMLYLASTADMFIAGVGESLWLPVILAAFCVAGIFAGIAMRVQAFLFLGVGFLLLDLFAMIWHAAVDRSQTWVWYASGIVLGMAILALFALFEKRRNDVLGVVDRIRKWD